MRIEKRVGYPRAIFHLTNRGARKVAIFTGDDDRRLFRNLLANFSRKHGIPMHAWSLMPNHYHLETTSEGTPLTRLMRDLDGTYAHLFNERHGTTGRLFQGPFRSHVIRDAEGAVYVSRYIHQNSLDVGFSPEAFPWSSARAYLGLEEVPDWLDVGPILETGIPGLPTAGESYLEYLQAPRRRRRRARRPEDDIELELVRLLDERTTEWILKEAPDLGQVQAATVTCWVGQRLCKLGSGPLADYFGYAGPGTVRVAAARFQERLDQIPALQEAMSRFRVPISRTR
jgi:REP element-mobilizing transposase RayT